MPSGWVLTIRVLEAVEADQGTGQGEERLMDVVPPFIAEFQPAVLVQPGLGPLDDPPVLAQAAPVGRPPLTDDGLPAPVPDGLAVGLGVEPAVPLDPVEPAA